MAAITLDIGGNTRRLDRDIQKTVNRVYTINLKTKGDQPLGRITGQVNEFNKSLDASNARVIAFGASAGIIFGVQRAFSALIQSTIEVQKSLQDINVILNVSVQNLQKFGSELFNIAKNTGQSFQEVAKAATEFSRQGLGVEETLKRTNEALILSRLSGLDAAKSVEALTAAVNSYASEAVTATEVVNKFANVDAAFAVSSADLADALARVGSSAAQSGVSLNELIAIVTSAQQTTARGGAVIGNSFKTIFTRLQRGRVVDLLGTLGISDTNASGELKSTIQLLQDLGKVYDTLGARQQAAVAEQVGGVFQINILKAALADLGKEYSIYSSALNVAASTTDQAIRRNEELNKTYAAQLNALQENARQIASAAGERLIGPSIDRLVGGSNTILGGINESDGQGVGAVLGKGIIDGLGQFIAGPGLALLGGVLLKLFRDLGKFATGSVQQLLGLNTAATQQKDLQASISQILAKNPQLLELALKGEEGLNTAANSLLASLQKQTVELQKQAAVAAQLSKAFVSQAGVRVAGGIPVAPPRKPGKAAGYIPNFAEELQAKELGAPSSVKSVSGVGKIGGKSFEANNKEFQIPDFGGTGETAVIPKYGGGIKEATKMIARGESGSVLDKSDRNRARGFVPNFAQKSKRGYSVLDGDSLVIDKDYPDKRLQGKEMRLESVDAIESWQKYGKTGSPNAKSLAESIINKEFPNLDSALKSSGKTGKAAYDRPYFNSTKLQKQLIENGLGVPDLRYGSTLKGLTMQVMNKPMPIGLWSDKNKDGFYNHPKAQQFIKQNNLEKKLSSRTDISNNKKNFILGSATRFGTGRYGGELLRDIIPSKGKPGSKNYKPERGYNYQSLELASGFIPNFAKQKQASKNAIDLGNLDTIPNELGNKVVSLIYPGLSDGYSLRPATANYLKQDYRGNIPVAGINQKTLKSQLPDLDENLGNLLVREANQFGQSLGGTNFLKSAKELPNFGAAKGAVGVAFEAGVQTLLQQKIGRKQNAGIDFRNITPRLRSIFNGAPGMYDAKSSPDLTNEVFKKLLNETRPGATVQKSSGQAGKDYAAKRSAAVNQLRQEGVTGSVAIRQALRDRFGIVGKAAGYIPNFAAIQDAVSRERAAGVPSNQIYLAQEKALTGANPMGIGVFNKTDEPTAGKRREQMKRKGFGRGFIPNFAIEDPDTQGADFGTAAAAITAGLSTLAFAFAFNGNQYKESLKELTQANLKRAKEELKQSRLEARRLEKRGLGNFATTAREDASKRFRSAATPGAFTKARAFGGANALGLSVAAPIIGETIKNIAGQETATQRGIGATGGALGQIGSFAATGGLVAGPKGVAIGAAVGALLSVPDAINQFTSTLPDLTAAAKKAGEDLTKFSDVSQRLLTTSDSLKNLITENAPPDKLKKVQDDFAKALSELSPVERARVDSAAKLNKLEEELAKITKERIDKQQSTVTAESLQAIEEKKKFGVFAGGFDTSTKEGKEDAKVVGKAFSDLFTAGKTPEESLERFNKAASNGIPQLQNLIQSVGTFSKAQQLYSSGSVGQLRGILENIVPKVDDPNDQEAVTERAQRIDTLVKIADDDISGFINLAKTLIGTLTKDPKAIAEAENAIKNYQETVAKEEKNKKAATKATEKVIESLERNIRVAQIAADKNRALAQSNTLFARDNIFSDAFSRPTETVGAIVGKEAPLAESFALREEIAKIGFDQIQGTEDVKFELVKNIEDSISAAFGEALTETREKVAPKEGTAAEIDKVNKNILAPLAQQQEKAFSTVQNVLNKTLSPGTDINTEQLLKDINNSLVQANIDSATREKISTQIRESADEGNISIEKLRNTAIQEFKTVAKEQSQKILIAKIGQAQTFGGGIEEFVADKSPGERLFEKVVKSTEGFDQFQGQQADFRFDYKSGTNDFKYQSGAAERARKEMAPEYGRSALELIDGLQGFTGYTPDPDGKAIQAGTAGLKEFYDKQISELQKIAQDRSTPQIVKDEINSALKEVSKLGGTENIAKLQVAQRTGSLTEASFKEITGKFQSPVLEALKEQAKSIKDPEDRARFEQEIQTLSSDILISSDPTVKAINVTNNILKQILTKGFEIPYEAILSSPASPPKTESKARGYIPAFNQESRAISRGVGGAKAGDRPKFIPNLNGIPAFVNTGEQLVDNYMGSGETAVLTREMQNTMGLANGFIPNFAEKIKLENIEYKDSPIWDQATNQAKKISGQTSMVSLAERDIVVVKVNGVEIPFYRSTGKAGKKAVASGKFYPVLGIGEDGWINKGTQSQINDFYGSPELKKIANQLDTELAGVKGKPVGAKAIEKSVNRGLTKIGVFPVENGLANTPKQLQENLQRILGKVGGNNKIPNPAKLTEVAEFRKKFMSGRHMSMADYRAQSEAYSKLSPDSKGWLQWQGNMNLADKMGTDVDKMRGNKSGTYSKWFRTPDPEPIKAPIKPSELGGKGKNASKIVEDTFRSGFKRVTDTSTYIDDITKASQEEVSNLAIKDTEQAAARQAAKKSTAKAAGKAGGNIAGKAAGKAVGKSALKKLPLGAGLLAGLYFATERLGRGDYTGAGLEVASGATSIVPGIGTAASVGIDAALAVRDIQTSTAEATQQTEIDAKARGSARGRKQTPEEKEVSKEKNQKAVDKARYEFSTAFNKNWPLNSKDQQEFAKLWSGKPANETITDFTKRLKESAPKRNYKTNITKATKDDIDQFYQRGQYAPLGSKERTDYENKSKMSQLTSSYNAIRYGAIKKTKEVDYSMGVPISKERQEINYPTEDSFSLFQDPIQKNFDSERMRSQYVNPTFKTEKIGLINGRPAIEWENDARIDAMDGRVKRGEISQENANKVLEGELSKKTIENRRKERAKTSPKVIGGKDNKPAMQVGPTGSADYVPKAVGATPAEVEKERQESIRPKSAYPGGLSPETARSIVQELDANYNESIKNQKNPQIAQAWAETQQRYRLLYSQGKYEELDRFYQSLQKNSQRSVGQNPNKNQARTNFATGFIPNFAQGYISNLANLESGLSGEKAQLTNIPGIGLAMINSDQTPGKFPAKDHPEGKMAAIKNSMKMQKSMGVMNKGYIPNFAATDQSFAQQEAAFNSNTSALTTLAGGIESLNSTISNFQSNFANLNNASPAQAAAGLQQPNAQPNVQTTTNAPVNVVVNAQGSSDIAAAVGEAVQNAIPTIIDKVKVALGQKVPPKSSQS